MGCDHKRGKQGQEVATDKTKENQTRLGDHGNNAAPPDQNQNPLADVASGGEHTIFIIINERLKQFT